MSRLKREEYISENAKQLEEQLKLQIKEDKIRAEAQRIVSKIPLEKRQAVLDILSRELGAK